jgi:CRISPR-associated protein Csm4
MIKLIKFHFKAPLHLGKAGLGLEDCSSILHSDTLYSSLFQVWMRLYDSPLPEMRLSSAYPYIKSDYYFPRPMLPMPGFTAEMAQEYGKSLKRAKFITQKHFNSWIRGSTPDCEEILVDTQQLQDVMEIRVRPRVSLDRCTSDSALYFVGETFFDHSEDSGLFFMVDLEPENWPEFQTILWVLGEEGIGGLRSQGYGVFEPYFSDDYPLEEIAEPDAYLTLSLFYPTNIRNLSNKLIAYQLVERMGWVESAAGNPGFRHKRVLMFAEGSVFQAVPQGTLVDVTPPGYNLHHVYRNGLAFPVGVKVGVEA